MADEQAKLKQTAKEQNIVLSNTTTSNVLANADKKDSSSEQYKQLLNAFNDNTKSLNEIRQEIKKFATKQRQKGKISKQTQVAVHLQMDDEQLQKKISQFGDQTMFINLQGDPSKIKKFKAVIQQIRKQALQGDTAATKLLKSLNTVDFKNAKDVKIALSQLEKQCKAAGTSIQTLYENSKKSTAIFKDFKSSVQKSSAATEDWKNSIQAGIKSLTIFNKMSAQTVARTAATAAGLIAASKAAYDAAKEYKGIIQSVIKYNRQTAQLSAKGSDLIPGGAKQLDDIRRQMNLTRQQTVQLGESINSLRGTTHDVNDLTAAMQGMKDTIGYVDTSKLKQLTQLMKQIPKQQLDALTGKGGIDPQGAANSTSALLTMQKSGNLSKFDDLATSGALGKDMAEAYGVKINQNDKNYQTNKRQVQTMKQTAQNKLHDATSGVTQFLPYLQGIESTIGEISKWGGRIAGIWGTTAAMLKQTKDQTRQIGSAKNAVEKNEKTTNDVKNTISSKASETNGKLDSLHANLCGGGSIHDIVGKILDKISEQQNGSSSEDNSTDSQDNSTDDQNNDSDTQEKSKNKKQKKREKKKYTQEEKQKARKDAGSKQQVQKKRQQRRQAKRAKKAEAKAKGGKQARIAQAKKASMLKEAKKVKLAKKGTSAQRLNRLLRNPKAMQKHGKSIQRLLSQNIANKNFVGKGLGMGKNFVANNIPFGQQLLKAGSKLGNTKIGQSAANVGSKVIGKANTKIGELAGKVVTTRAGQTAMKIGSRGAGRMLTRAGIAIGGKTGGKVAMDATKTIGNVTKSLSSLTKVVPYATAALGAFQFGDSLHTSFNMGNGQKSLNEKNKNVADKYGLNPKLLSNSVSQGITNAYGDKSVSRSISNMFRTEQDVDAQRLAGGNGIKYGQLAGDFGLALAKISGGIFAIKAGIAATLGTGGLGAVPGIALAAGGGLSIASGVVDIANIGVVISQMKENAQQRKQFYKSSIKAMKQSDKVVQENMKQLNNVTIANRRVMQDVKTRLDQISSGVLSAFQDLIVQTQSLKMDKAIILGTNNDQFSTSRKNMAQNASVSYDKNMQALQDKKAQVMSNNDISSETKTAMLAQIMQKEIQLRQKYQKNLLKALSLDNIPSVMQNALQKKFSQAKLDLSNTGWFTDSAGNAAQQADILMKSFQDLQATTAQMAQNQAHKAQFAQQNKQRQQALYRDAFGGSASATAEATKKSSNNAIQEYIEQSNKDIEKYNKSAWNLIDFGATTDNNSIIVNANKAAKEGKEVKRDQSGYNTSDDDTKKAMRQSNHRLSTAIASDDTSDQVLRQVSAQRMILKQVAHVNGGKKIYDLRKIAADEDADDQERTKAQEVVANYDAQMARLDTIQKNVMQRRAQKQRAASVAMYSQDSSKFTQGRDLKDHALLKDQNFKKRAQQAGAVDENGKIKNADAFKTVYQGARKQQLTRQLFKAGLNSNVKGTKDIFAKVKQQNKDLFDKDGNLRKDLNDQQRARANKVALQAYAEDQKFGNQMVAQALGNKDGKTYSENDKTINDTNAKLEAYSGTVGDAGWKQLLDKNVKASVSQLQLLKKSGKITSTNGKRQLQAAQSSADQLKLIQQAINKKGSYKGASGAQLQQMRQFKAKQLQQHINAAGSSVSKRDGNVVAFGTAATQIQQAARYQATTIMANTQNMQQLGQKFKNFSQSLQNVVSAINNDANVRRKQLQAQIAAQQKQVSQWTGDTKGTTAVGVYQKQMQASQQKLKVAAHQRGSLSKIQQAFGSDTFYKTVADQATTFVAQDTTLKKHGGQDAAKKYAAVFEKMQKSGKNLTDSDRQANVAQIGKITRQAKDAAMLKFLEDNGVAKAGKLSPADKQKQLKRIIQSNGSAKSQWQHISGGFDNMNAVFSSLAKGEGQVAVALQQIRSVQLQALSAQAASTKKMIQSLMTVRQTITKVGTQVRQKLAGTQLQLSSMNMGGAKDMVGSTKEMMQQSKVRYDDQKQHSATAIKDAQSLLKSAKEKLANAKTPQQKKKAQQNLKQAQVGLDAAKAHDKNLDLTFMKQQAQRLKRGMDAFCSTIATSLQSIQIAQQYAQSVSGTTQQWYKLENQKLAKMRQQVDGLRQFTKTQQFQNLSAKDKQDTMNRLNKAQLKLAQERIGAQRNVFEKQLGAILGGLQQQGAFKGFNQASVFGVGHGINQAGMAVAMGQGDSKNGYQARLLAANEQGQATPTQWKNKGDVGAVADTANNMGKGNSSSSSSSSSSSAASSKSQSSSSSSSSTNAKNVSKAKSGATEKTQQQKSAEQKQKQVANLKDHEIFVKQLLTQQKILQAITKGLGVAIDKTTGKPEDKNKKPSSSKDIKGGQSKQVELRGRAEQSSNVPAAKTTAQSSNAKQTKKQLIKNEIAEREKFAQTDNFKNMSKQDQEKYLKQTQLLKKQQNEEDKKDKEVVRVTKDNAETTTQNEKAQQSKEQALKRVQAKPKRVNKEQYQKAKKDLKTGWWSGKNSFEVKRSKLADKRAQLDQKIKNAKSIDQKIKLQEQRDKVLSQFKQTNVDQKTANQNIQKFELQQKNDKAQFETADALLTKQGGKNGKTTFDMIRQRNAVRYQELQDGIKRAKTPQQKQQLQRRKANLIKSDKQNTAEEQRARQVVEIYKRDGNLDKLYEKQGSSQQTTQQSTQQGASKKEGKKQGVVSITQGSNNNSEKSGNIRRIPFEDMSSDNRRGRINGYIQVQTIRRVVISSSDINSMKQMSTLQGAGATS